MSKLIFLALLFIGKSSYALVNCAPTSCSPSCDSSCSYQTCTAPASHSITIKELPYTYIAKSDACSDELDGQVIRQLPHPAPTNQLPATINRPYLQCQTQTISGPPCPPPPPLEK